MVRADVVASMEKLSEAIGPESVVQITCVHLELENPELREEGFKWIIEHKEGIKGADHSVMFKPLICCLMDKTSKVRQSAEEVIIEVMAFTGIEPFHKQLKDLKPAE